MIRWVNSLFNINFFPFSGLLQQSLKDLVTKMNASTPHFVRCIKPNVGKISTQFGKDYVITQLRYSGIMETISIRKQGYPMRIKFGEFLER